MRAYRITVPQRDEDLAVSVLWEAGTAGIEMETLPGGRSALLAYFDDEAPLTRLGEELSEVTIEAVAVPDVDWVARFRESFRAFRAGGFVIAPPWDRPAGGAPALLVDPGRAFGTGTHETTRLCLRFLEDLAERGPLGRVIDVGAGTGILGIAAARLGARRVVASDLDPEATASARTHASLNGVRLHVVRGHGAEPFRHGIFDVVMANITAPLLTTHAAPLAALRCPGGALILSGLLDSDLPEVRRAFGACGTPEVRREGEWAALLYGAPA